ncbi:MAG: site-specific integrase [Xenococcaceae cyanobacterium MO_234.B1]|nr:site-specific integrase [Xenococcaceae cyanobacterium MO_234.B1]
MKNNRNHPPISFHTTLNGQLEVNWDQEYNQEYHCPNCNKGKLVRYYYDKTLICKINLYCNNCDKRTNLTCHVPSYIYNYISNIECPNELCKEIGHNGQRGWIYQVSSKNNRQCKCRFCKIQFDSNSKYHTSWMGQQTENKLQEFSFDEDSWQLKHFFKNPRVTKIYFHEINPDWYRQVVKKYIHFLLKIQRYYSERSVLYFLNSLKQLGKTIISLSLENKSDINRNTVNVFLDNCKHNKNVTINKKLAHLRDFFDWLDLDTPSLIRSRDVLKISHNDPDWLDEVTRKAIESHLHKIPKPIASHYLIQSYTGARPRDICNLLFKCLIEENGQWYVKFFQHKTQRWHKIFANRKIRRIIEEQQQWIQKVIGEDYPYLFCHFRSIKQLSYPTFPNIKPLPEPPLVDTKSNPMVGIIRILIEKENVLDVNGQKPHFTGKITRSTRGQEVRTKYGMEAARLLLDHKSSKTTFQHYAPPTREQVAEVDLPFHEVIVNSENKFLPWQSLPHSLLKNLKAHELDPGKPDSEVPHRYVVYGHCILDPKTPCPINIYPKCYGCSSFRPSTAKLPLYERQYQGEQQRLAQAKKAGASAEVIAEEAKETIEAMDKWLRELRKLADEQ